MTTEAAANRKIRVAHLAGPTATIQNTPPLVTSNKARQKRGLPPRPNPDGTAAKFDALRAQRLAAPVKVYVEQFSAHPLEADTAELYGPPDGYLAPDGSFSAVRKSDRDKPVYEIELKPEDGLYPLPYMAVQADGSPWEEEMAVPGGPEEKARQSFFPDGSRHFEEIDRLSVSADGVANLISSQAEVDFFRIKPSGGYKNGLSGHLRTDGGDGDIAPEKRGHDFDAYKPYHLLTYPARPTLAIIANGAQAIADSGRYDGLVWTQGSPQIEETAYWLSLLVHTTLPICVNGAQRAHGEISADGPKNVVDAITYIGSGVWKDDAGQDKCGAVAIQEQQIFAAREVAKSDARPGNYRALGGHGGVLGQITYRSRVYLTYLPAHKHTHRSEVTIRKLPRSTKAAQRIDGTIHLIDMTIKDDAGKLLASAIPSVTILKDGSYADDEANQNANAVPWLAALLEYKLSLGRPAGLVMEGLVPYGLMPADSSERFMMRAAFCGIPVVRTARSGAEGFADATPFSIGGSNLSSTKARLLLIAALMKLGALPPAKNPDAPTDAEKQAVAAAVAHYQEIFDTH